MTDVGSLFLAGESGVPPNYSWSPGIWIILALGAGFVFLALQKPARRSKQLFRVGAMAVLAIAAVGTAIHGYQLVGPLDDQNLGLCPSQDPNLASTVADKVLVDCPFRTPIALSRGETIAVALRANWNVDEGEEWTDLSVSDSWILSATGGSPSQFQGPDNSLDYTVSFYRASHPGETKFSAAMRFCNLNRGTCDRGTLLWASITVM